MFSETERGRHRWYVEEDDGKAICGGVPSYATLEEAQGAAVRSYHLLGVELQLAGLLSMKPVVPIMRLPPWWKFWG